MFKMCTNSSNSNNAFCDLRRRGSNIAKLMVVVVSVILLSVQLWYNGMNPYRDTLNISSARTNENIQALSDGEMKNSTTAKIRTGVEDQKTSSEGMKVRSENEGYNNSSNNNDADEFEFKLSLRLKLRQRLCPKSVPDVSLGSSLFRMARMEFGLTANSTSIGNGDDDDDGDVDGDRKVTDRHNLERIADFFYNGGFGFTIYIDGSDPQNTVFYAPVWKCANNQIHDYLYKLLNRREDGSVQDPFNLDTGHPNDTLLIRLNIDDINFLFHEAREKSSISSGKRQHDGAPVDGDDDSNIHNIDHPDEKQNETDENHYFNFNNTSRTKPCVFTVLRDPISHFLAGYNEVEYRLVHGESDAPNASELDKLASYAMIQLNQDSKTRELRFITFVQNLLEGHPSFVNFDYYKHFAAMSRILPTLSKLDLIPSSNHPYTNGDSKDTPSYTSTASSQLDSADRSWYLPTLENLLDTFPRFLTQACPRMASNYYRQHRPMSTETYTGSHLQNQSSASDDSFDMNSSNPYPPMELWEGHESQLDSLGTHQAAKDVWKKGGAVSRALCILHAMDYACFPDGLEIPPICREVYSSDAFVDTILAPGT
mmetsp:Transcript_12968/g.30586  ORF Transcript_12968/g.30586 Transcript_12968/m.30586 type:complete len:596 (-) Transcript_12968:315-2102(-)